MDILLACVLSATTTVLLISTLAPLAQRIGLADEPGPAKLHDGRIALVGGIAIFCGFWIGTLALDTSLHDYRPFLAASFLLVVVGVLDDFRELTPSMRINAQVVAALLMIYWGGAQVDNLGSLVKPATPDLSLLILLVTLVGTVGAINAMNLIDGIDGLCGALALVTFLSIAFLSGGAGVYREFALSFVLVTTIVAFLWFNLSEGTRKKVFMGDAGSMFLGFAAAWFLTRASQGSTPILSPATALWIFAVPLIDTVAVMIRRVLRRQSPLCGDRTHLHHLLMEAGLGPRGALAVMFAWAGLMATIGIAAQRWQVDGRIMLAGFVGVFLVTLGGTILAARGHDRRGEQRLAPAGALQRVAARPSAGVSGDAADQL